MRKIYWFGLSALAAGGLFWTVRQSVQGPGGYLGGCCQRDNSCPGCYQSLMDDPLEEIPSEPVEIEPAPIAAIEPAPASIVIVEDEPRPADPVAEVAVDLAIFKGPPVAPERVEPRTMPYADDELPPMMPYIEDAETPAVKKPVASKHHRPMMKEYPGCPCEADGGLLPVSAPAATATQPMPEVAGSEEESEVEPELPVLKPCESYRNQLPPGIDTMEFRKSDRTIGEYGPGPT